MHPPHSTHTPLRCDENAEAQQNKALQAPRKLNALSRLRRRLSEWRKQDNKPILNWQLDLGMKLMMMDIMSPVKVNIV